METANLPITDEVIERKYDKVNIVLDYAHVALSNAASTSSTSVNLVNRGSSPNNFTIMLPTPLKDVVGVCLTGVDIFDSSQGQTVDTVYLSINDYNMITSGNPLLPPAFYRIGLIGYGYTAYNLSNPTNLGMNTYTYVADPIIGKLDRFNVKFYKNDGTLYTFNNLNTLRVVVTLTVYMKRNKYSRV